MWDKHLALIGGAGKIGSAILSGMLGGNAADKTKVYVTARHARSLAAWQEAGVKAGTDNAEAVRDADVVILCVHPDEAAPVLQEVAEALKPGVLFVSVATGLRTADIERHLPAGTAVVRAMPNTAVHVGESMTAVCRGRHANDDDMDGVVRIFETVGEVETLDERWMNAATGLGGCGPAFVFKIIEALSEGGVKVGLPREAARKIAAQTLKGAAEMVLKTGKHPAALKDEVTTPGGCTIDGITKLEERGLPIALIEAVETSTRKAAALGDVD